MQHSHQLPCITETDQPVLTTAQVHHNNQMHQSGTEDKSGTTQAPRTCCGCARSAHLAAFSSVACEATMKGDVQGKQPAAMRALVQGGGRDQRVAEACIMSSAAALQCAQRAHMCTLAHAHSHVPLYWSMHAPKPHTRMHTSMKACTRQGARLRSRRQAAACAAHTQSQGLCQGCCRPAPPVHISPGNLS